MSDQRAEHQAGPTSTPPVGDRPGHRSPALSDAPETDAQREVTHSINQRIFDTSLDLILVVDRQGTFLRVSPSAETILGYSPQQMIGRSAAEFIHPDDLDATREEMRLTRRGRQMRNFDCRYLHHEGHAVMLAWTGVWSEPDGQHIFIGRDVTERRRLQAQLRHAQKMESIGQLTGGIAHDFNNLLAVIVGSIELLLDQRGITDPMKDHANNALHAAQIGSELTRRLLAFARQQPLEPKVVDLNALIDGMATLLSRTLGQHIEVSFVGAPATWTVFIDPANLESALANLALNARDAMPEGGRLTIESGNITLDEDYARDNPGVVPGEYATVIVTDTGAGMAPAVLERIFEPFFTTKGPGKGTGLGLSMVYGFIKQSGGHIKAYSEPGHGTSIRLYLPRARSTEAPQAAAPPKEITSAVKRHARILVVEDSSAIRQVVLSQLSRLGYETLEADGPAAALAILNSDTVIDLLFTDIIMPGSMSGFALAREARIRRPALKVLYTSGFPGAHLTNGNSNAITSRDAMIGKPYRFQELAEKIRGVLDQDD